MRDTFETGISHPFLVKKGASLIAFLVLVQHLSPLLKPYSFCLQKGGISHCFSCSGAASLTLIEAIFFLSFPYFTLSSTSGLP